MTDGPTAGQSVAGVPAIALRPTILHPPASPLRRLPVDPEETRSLAVASVVLHLLLDIAGGTRHGCGRVGAPAVVPVGPG